jgi:hypothetical protein
MIFVVGQFYSSHDFREAHLVEGERQAERRVKGAEPHGRAIARLRQRSIFTLRLYQVSLANNMVLRLAVVKSGSLRRFKKADQVFYFINEMIGDRYKVLI